MRLRSSVNSISSEISDKVHIALTFETGEQRVRVKVTLKQNTRIPRLEPPFCKTTFDVTLKYDLMNPVLQGYIEKSITINEKERVESKTKFKRFISSYCCLDLLDRLRVLARPDMEDEIIARDTKSLLSMFNNILNTDAMFMSHEPGSDVCGQN